MSRRLPCGCVLGDYADVELELCPIHGGAVSEPTKCADGCIWHDAETCNRSTWAYRCDCSCHGLAPDLTSEQVHDAREQHLMGRELADEAIRERVRTRR